MPRFVYDARAPGGLRVATPENPSVDKVFDKVKRTYAERLKRIEMSDSDIREVIRQVEHGTRNIRYLAPTGKIREREDIIYFIMREMLV